MAARTVKTEANPEALRMIAGKIQEWHEARKTLAAIERAEHPDITDHWGRVWTWASGDLYDHDKTLAIPRDWIGQGKLPSPKLAGNPNYARLCGICTSEWPQGDALVLF